MTATQQPIAFASSRNTLTLSQEGAGGAITIPLEEVDTICELLRLAKQAVLDQGTTLAAPPAPPVPEPISLPESVVAAWRADEADMAAPVSSEMPEAGDSRETTLPQ